MSDLSVFVLAKITCCINNKMCFMVQKYGSAKRMGAKHTRETYSASPELLFEKTFFFYPIKKTNCLA